MAAPHIVVLCDEPAQSRELEAALRGSLAPEGARLTLHGEAGPALRDVGALCADALVIALGQSSPLPVLEASRRLAPSVPVLVLPREGDVATAVAALKAGAADVLAPPLRGRMLVEGIARLLAQSRPRTTPEAGAILGASEPVRRMMALARQAAASFASVLIEGESGTGKGVLAEYLHRHNPRPGGNFVKINCAAVPEGLLEAELFGYEAGAFTGAVRQKKGRVEIADGGTLFLDEIGIAPLTFQAKLLRFLQDGEFERLGGVRTLQVRTRVISATNSDLKAAIRSGQLREDLYYRLDVIHIRVPALRERREDVPILSRAFLEEAARKNGRDVPRMRPEAMEALMAYGWPGNIRELQNLMERLVVLGQSGTVGLEDLPPEVHLAPRPRHVSIPLGVPLREVERQLMDEALKATGGDKKLAAELLGVHPRTLYRHLEGQKTETPPPISPPTMAAETRSLETRSLETPVEGGIFFA